MRISVVRSVCDRLLQAVFGVDHSLAVGADLVDPARPMKLSVPTISSRIAANTTRPVPRIQPPSVDTPPVRGAAGMRQANVESRGWRTGCNVMRCTVALAMAAPWFRGRARRRQPPSQVLGMRVRGKSWVRIRRIHTRACVLPGARLVRDAAGGRGCLYLEAAAGSRGSCPVAIRARTPMPSQNPSGIAADGEAPGWALAIRTRSTPGLIRKRSGGSSFIASPSIPAGTMPSASTSNSGADHSFFVGAPGRPPRLRPDATATPSRPSSILGRVPEPTARPSRYRLLETRMIAPVECSGPSGPLQRRSRPPPSGPSASGKVSRIVRSFASR